MSEQDPSQHFPKAEQHTDPAEYLRDMLAATIQRTREIAIWQRFSYALEGNYAKIETYTKFFHEIELFNSEFMKTAKDFNISITVIPRQEEEAKGRFMGIGGMDMSDGSLLAIVQTSPVECIPMPLDQSLVERLQFQVEPSFIPKVA